MKKNKQYLVFSLIILIFPVFIQCDKFLELNTPKTQVLSTDVFKNENTANAVLVGIYYSLHASNGLFNGLHTSIYPGLASDELNGAGSTSEFQFNIISSNNAQLAFLWQKAYNIIFQSNALIEGLENSNIDSEKKNQLRGEALYIRAYTYFYLVNFFGDVPLVLSSALEQSQNIPRTPVDDVYSQIIADLNNSNLLLKNDYGISGGERVRINRYGTLAFLARVHLYTGDWSKAETMATEVISNSELFELPDVLNSVFYANSKETIWQILQSNVTGVTFLGQQFIPPSAVSVPNYYLTPQLLNAFEEGDQRKLAWIDSVQINDTYYSFPYKYKNRVQGANREYDIQLRLAEQYLIRAEARVEQGNFPGALDDINKIRRRAGLPNTHEEQKSILLDRIYSERRLELFTEPSHRWFDLKRTNRADEVLSLIKPDWQSSSILFPIPQIELNKNPLLHQNKGY